MVATTWRETSIRPRSLAWISVFGGFPVRGGLAFVFESIRVLLCDADFAPIIRDDSGASKQTNTMAQRCAICGKGDRKSTRLNSSHVAISYAVFCLKKKKQATTHVEHTIRNSCANLLPYSTPRPPSPAH